MFRLFLRVLIGSLLVLVGILGVSYLQKRFDDGDERKALQAIQGKFQVQGCTSKVISRFRGLVQVQCGDRSWIVDVVHGAIGEGQSQNP